MAAKGNPKYNREQWKRYLRYLSVNGAKYKSAAKADMSHGRIGRIVKADPRRAAEEDEALCKYLERLESEADRRGVEGYDQDVYYEGEIVGQQRKFSDPLLMFRLRALDPDKYEKKKEGDGAATTTNVTVILPDNGRGGPGKNNPVD